MTALLPEGCLKPHPFLDGCSTQFLNHSEEFARKLNFASGESNLREGDYADSECSIPGQFDCVLHFDQTRAVQPLEALGDRLINEVTETYPTEI